MADIVFYSDMLGCAWYSQFLSDYVRTQKLREILCGDKERVSGFYEYGI